MGEETFTMEFHLSSGQVVRVPHVKEYSQTLNNSRTALASYEMTLSHKYKIKPVWINPAAVVAVVRID